MYSGMKALISVFALFVVAKGADDREYCGFGRATDQDFLASIPDGGLHTIMVDGHHPAVLSHDSTNGVRIAYGYNNGEYPKTTTTIASTSFCPVASGKIHVADINGDHKDDIICQDTTTGKFSVMFNNNGQFSSETSVAIGYTCVHDVYFGNYDGKAGDDILCLDDGVSTVAPTMFFFFSCGNTHHGGSYPSAISSHGSHHQIPYQGYHAQRYAVPQPHPETYHAGPYPVPHNVQYPASNTFHPHETGYIAPHPEGYQSHHAVPYPLPHNVAYPVAQPHPEMVMHPQPEMVAHPLPFVHPHPEIIHQPLPVRPFHMNPEPYSHGHHLPMHLPGPHSRIHHMRYKRHYVSGPYAYSANSYQQGSCGAGMMSSLTATDIAGTCDYAATGSINVLDMNNDGIDDILCSTTADAYHKFFGNGRTTGNIFSTGVADADIICAIATAIVVPSDVDGDGDKDITCFTPGATLGTTISFNDGSGDYAALVAATTANCLNICPTAFASTISTITGDFNHDGYEDFVCYDTTADDADFVFSSLRLT